MFPLFQKELPTSATQLAAALGTGLRHAMDISGDPIVVRAKAYPELEEIAVDLSGARIRIDAPRPRFPVGEGERVFTVRHFVLRAHPLSFGGAAIDLDVEANSLVLHENRDSDDNIFLFPHHAGTGRIALSIQPHDLETLIAEIAKAEAGRQGVVIEDVLLNLTSRGPRSLGAELRVQARKLFLRTALRIAGHLEIDDQFVAHISNLSCAGEGGAIGTLVSGILTPHLQKLQAREFPLRALELGEIKLHDIQLDASDGIKLTAEFGSAPAAKTA
jgi:hypothetical protein